MTVGTHTREETLLRILFVDDDELVLSGLKRMLHDMREWDVLFASSAAEALELLGERSVDVVVSDLRMAGMTGLELLETVRRRFPDVVRIVLSGAPDRELFLQSASAAHQYLAMPCGPEQLKTAVTSARFLRDVVPNGRLIEVASRMTNLPSRPNLYLEILTEARSPDGSMERVGEIISRDVGMTAKILQLVNSAYFGLQQHLASPQEAVAYLGFDTIRALVLSVQVFSQFDESKLRGSPIADVWDHSIRTARLAQKLAEAQGASQQVVDEAFMAGMLHDAGELVLAANLPDELERAHELAQESSVPRFEAESTVLGASHAEVGAYLLAIWGRPQAIVEAIAWHHRPSDSPDVELSVLTAVHAASAIDRSAAGEDLERVLDRGYLERLGLADRIPEWIALRAGLPRQERPA